MEKLNASDSVGAMLVRGAGHSEEAHATGVYTVACFGADGKEKWTETFDNIVTTQGKNYLLTSGFKGASFTNISYMSLITNAAPGGAASDTYQIPGTVVEVGSGVISARQPITWATAVSGSLSPTAPISFTIGGGGATVTGCMVVMVANTAGAIATRGDTSAGPVLYSSGTFATPKVTSAGDVLSVTYTASL